MNNANQGLKRQSRFWGFVEAIRKSPQDQGVLRNAPTKRMSQLLIRMNTEILKKGESLG